MVELTERLAELEARMETASVDAGIPARQQVP
jgi:hypothetical protein